MHRTRGGHTASKPIDHMWSTQHHVRHSEALIWIEFRVKQLTLMPATCREHRGYAQHETLGTPPVLTLEHRGKWACSSWLVAVAVAVIVGGTLIRRSPLGVTDIQ